MNQDFQSAVQQTLGFLHDRFGFALWMLTRTEGTDWIVLAAEDDGYGIVEGTVLPWQDSLCIRMVQGLGPRIAPDVGAVDSYAAAPISTRLTIGSYIGVPLRSSDGALFGTLCAIDPAPQPDHIREEQPLIELLAGLLNRLLNAELEAGEALRRAERAEVEMMRDGLTSLYNRRGWEQLLGKEEGRCRRYGHPACVIAVDLDELKKVNDNQGHAAGDTLLKTTARAILATVRDTDVAARLGGDEFGILAIESDAAAAASLVDRLRARLLADGVKASIGLAMRRPDGGLSAAAVEADAAMYADKKARKGVLPGAD